MTEISKLIKSAKSTFIKVIKHINKHNIVLSSNIKSNLKSLILLWRDNQNKDVSYYFKMKDNHTNINGKISDEVLQILWMDYLEIAMKLRLVMMKNNYLS